MFRCVSSSVARAAAAATTAAASAPASSPFLETKRFNSSSNKDFYKILGVPKGADLKEIKKAYRKRALETHPDQGGSKEEFAQIAEAYEVLSNPEKRQVYDQYGSEAATNPHMSGGMGGAGGGMGGRSPEDIFAEFFKGMGGRGGPFGDMFGGGGGGAWQRRPKVVEPKEVRIRLTLEEVYSGVEKTIRVTRPQICSDCNGCGTKSKTEKPTCAQCNGAGQVVQQHRVGPGMVQQTIAECPKCRGTGTTAKPDDQCPKCQSKGYRNVAQDVSLEIPAGVPSNVTLVVHGEGGVMPGAQPGDLHVHIEVNAHKVFERRGDDLIVRRDITLSDALLGLHFPLKLLDGRTIHVETPKDSVLRPDGVVKIPGEGMPSSTGGRGDVYVFTTLKMPAKLTKKQEDAVREAFGESHKDAKATAGNTVKARVMRESREQLEDQKRGVWSAQQQMGGGGGQSRGHPGAQQAECATQ